MTALLLSPVLVVVLVAAGYVYVSSRHTSTPSPQAAAPTSQAPAPSPTPALGPWKHISNRTQDSAPLTDSELFPAAFSGAGFGGTQTIVRASKKCLRAVIGSKLRAAVHKAHCTQVLRASYLSSDHKLMATIGVLNLINVTAAKRVGKASGATEFIKQLPAAHGPTHKLDKGTGLEEADVMGHYLILTWAEFANLHKPSGHKQLNELKDFSTELITGTANKSLTSRMVTGKPAAPTP
jgi:hypothetical protein